MSTKRLQHQLPLLADPRAGAQTLPHDARVECVELIARMIVHVVRERGAAEARDECR